MRRLPACLPAPGVVHFFGESVIPCHDRMGGRTANECLTTNKRISAPHSLIRFLFVDGLLLTGWKACST